MESILRSQTTEGVRISVKVLFSPEHSDVLKGVFSFSYQITICNESEEPIQLLTRHWDIVDAAGARRRVEGPGVVGEQPILAPNQTHVYASGASFVTPIGQMRGCYTFIRLTDGTLFRATIPDFVLVWPPLLN